MASANVAVISRNLDEEYPSLATAAARTVPRPIQAKLKRPVRSDLSAKAVALVNISSKPKFDGDGDGDGNGDGDGDADGGDFLTRKEWHI